MGETFMRIPKYLKDRLLKELDFCIHKIREEEDIKKKLYFFSGTYSAVERIMRLHPNEQLVFVNAVLNLSYGSFTSLVESRARGDIARELPENFSTLLVEYLTELRNKISEGKDIYKTLEKFVNLAFQTTGPGYYTAQFFEYLKSKS